jgi:hypothetical protein
MSKIKVKAIRKGYYGLLLREPNTPGEVFEIEDESEFSDKWMEKLDHKQKDDAARAQDKHEEAKVTGKPAVPANRKPVI